MINLEEIKAREQAATPGPWEWRATVDEDAVGIVSPGEVVMCGDVGYFHIGRKDAEFISRARTDIPALIEQHEQDQQQIATLKKALELESEHIASTEYFPKDKTKAKENSKYISEHFIHQAQQLTDGDASESGDPHV